MHIHIDIMEFNYFLNFTNNIVQIQMISITFPFFFGNDENFDVF